jgi:hypothetical protein
MSVSTLRIILTEDEEDRKGVRIIKPWNKIVGWRLRFRAGIHRKPHVQEAHCGTEIEG